MKRYIDGYKLVGNYKGINAIKVFDKCDSMSDPILRFKGYYFNYYDIDSALFEHFKEELLETGAVGQTEETMLYHWETMPLNSDRIKYYFLDCIFGGYKFRSIEKLVASYTH